MSVRYSVVIAGPKPTTVFNTIARVRTMNAQGAKPVMPYKPALSAEQQAQYSEERRGKKPGCGCGCGGC